MRKRLVLVALMFLLIPLVACARSGESVATAGVTELTGEAQKDADAGSRSQVTPMAQASPPMAYAPTAAALAPGAVMGEAGGGGPGAGLGGAGGGPGVPMDAPDAASGQAATQPPGMFFQDYGTNPFVDATQDNLSTFAVDVDTGSYTLMRSYLNDGILPPAEAIRPEEFINYFRQDYALPQQGEGFNLIMEGAPTPFNAKDSYVLRVGVQGYDIPSDQRTDALLIFVIDVSGSMDMENRLGAVKVALNMLIDQLRPTDQIGIVVYGSEGRVLLEPTQIGQNENTIRAAINALRPEGSTNAEQGLRLAYDMASAQYGPEKINRLILCSDGVANVGATGPDAILESVRVQAARGITLTTVGFGMGNYNDVLMEQLADDGDGAYFYVDSQDEARRIFVDRLTGTLQTIAKDAKIQVEFNAETVSAYRLIGYENRDVADTDFRNDAVDAGEIGAGHSVTALYEIIPTGQAQGLVATARLRWENPDTGEVTEIEQTFTTDEIAPDFDSASARFRLDAVVAAFADVMGDGGWSQNTDLNEILEIVRPIADELGNDPDVQEFVDLIRLAIGLQD